MDVHVRDRGEPAWKSPRLPDGVEVAFRAAADMCGCARTFVRGASPKSPLSGFGLLYLTEALSEI